VESPRSSSGSIRSAAPAPNPGAPVTRSQRRRDAARTPATPIASRQTLPDELLLIVDTGERIQVAAGASVMLGRRPASDTDLTVTVTDPTVSKNHARLENRATGVWVTDLDSTNGTELVDEAGRAIGIAAHVPTRVEEGMRVRIGDRMFTVSRLIGTGA
jgi:pSer/pThr/pTyr-binding forkhead associated (FHA) protein